MFNPAAALAEFLDSVSAASSTYGQALPLQWQRDQAPTRSSLVEPGQKPGGADLPELVYSGECTPHAPLRTRSTRNAHGGDWASPVWRDLSPAERLWTSGARDRSRSSKFPRTRGGLQRMYPDQPKPSSVRSKPTAGDLGRVATDLRERARQRIAHPCVCGVAGTPSPLPHRSDADSGKDLALRRFSNTQEIPLDTVPGCLQIAEARRLYDQVVRSPE